MTLDIHNWSSSAHLEIHKIRKDEIFPIVNQVDARVQNFEIQFLKEAAKFVPDFKSLTKEADESLAKHKASELEIKRLVRAVVSQDIMSIVKNPSVVYSSNLQTELERKLPSSSRPKLYVVTPLPKSMVFPKVGKTHALLKPVTLNSVPTPTESKVVKNDKVIALGMFRINPSKNSREIKSMPNKPINASVRIKQITDPQPHVITKKVVNSDSHGFSSTGVDITTKTRRPQPRSNTIHDRVLYTELLEPILEPHQVPQNESNVISEVSSGEQGGGTIEQHSANVKETYTINPSKNSREIKSVPNKPVNASVRTKQITDSQPHVITKKVVNSDSHGFSSTRVDITTKTRRPQPRSNTIHDRVLVTDIIKKDKIQAKPDKTKHKTESVEKSKVNQSQQKVNLDKVKVIKSKGKKFEGLNLPNLQTHNFKGLKMHMLKTSDANSSSSSEIAILTHAVNQQTSAVTTAITAILKQFQETLPLDSVKAVEEICVTCGSAHPYYQCLAAGGNTFSKLRDNIQGYVAAVIVNYNQGNFGYRPLGVANQIRPSDFVQPNVQNNQNRFSQPQVYNQGNNFNQDQSYQAPTQQNPLCELKKIKRVNEANMKAMQTQINNVKNELRNEMNNSIQASMSNQTNELKNMMASFFQMNTTSTLGSGSLPSNTIANLIGLYS
nr:hypothetical protein [Tanacetum cinerariifolium]